MFNPHDPWTRAVGPGGKAMASWAAQATLLHRLFDPELLGQQLSKLDLLGCFQLQEPPA